MYVDNALQTLTGTSLTLTTSKASLKGGVFYLNQALSVTLTTSTFSSFSAATTGSFMHSAATTLTLTMTSNTIQCFTTAYTYASNLLGKINLASPTSDLAGAFYLTSSLSVTSTSNTYQFCYLCAQGAIYTLLNIVGAFTDTNSKYTSNAALTAGVIYLSKTKALITGATFANSYAVNGGVFYTYDASDLTVTSSTFDSSTVVNNGGIGYFSENSASLATTNSIKFDTCTFTTQTAGA